MAEDPVFFASPAKFRTWLTKHHGTEEVLWVGYHKVATGRPSLTWAQSVDEALCFGWIDGRRMRIDADRYKIRFTPRKSTSNWSAVNVRRFQELLREGLVAPAGVRAFERRSAKRTGVYAYENRARAKFTAAQGRAFRRNPKGWTFFQAQPPSYRSLATWWVNSAKKEETRANRFARLLTASARGRRLGGWERAATRAAKGS
jgi:uncharacterized protein YdeI (YjbR/CyaY-like superfamily)